MFNSPFYKQIDLPRDAEIVVVSDLFAEDYTGGAELTTQALIDTSLFNVFKLHSKDVTMQLLQKGHNLLWIFGNYAQLNQSLIPTIIGNMKYVVLEYDYKFCRYRSPEKHQVETGLPCDCHNVNHGKLISAFYHAAASVFWMSEAQKEIYLTKFPFLETGNNVVLSSVFSPTTLLKIRKLREQNASNKDGWIVLGSPSWIKGSEDAITYCQRNGLKHEVLWNVPYDQLLEKMSKVEGLVYLPKGADTCPRLTIEAKLLGCKTVVNEYVQHSKETWFETDNLLEIEQYLYAAPGLFWNACKKIIDYQPTLSGYTTVYNAFSRGYPFIQSIKSMLDFCDEVCIADGGSDDDTLELLKTLNHDYASILSGSYTVDELGFINESRVKVKVVKRDWNHPRFAVFDGMQKAEARKMCTKEFCWQMDCDEIVHENHAQKIRDLCKGVLKSVDIIALPVVEYWGGCDKVRIDITPWKWRLTRNKSYITHGIPQELRAQDKDGNTYALAGDGCDFIHTETGQRIPFLNFWTNDLQQLRQAALSGDKNTLQALENVFNRIVEDVPCVFHYSWYNLERKIKLYRDYWTRHWNVLCGKDYADTAETNMFFDVPWSQVTDEMIQQRAQELKCTGGHVWHSKWDGQVTPWINVQMSEPKVML